MQPAHASTSTSGGAQIQYTSAASATLALVTQYGSGFTQGNGVGTLLPSVAGTCAGSVVEPNFTLTFGSLVPQTGSAVGCLYKNALAVSVQTNDAAGFSVNEYLDAPPGNGVGICAYPNGGGSFPLTPVVLPIPTSSRSGNPAAGTFSGSALASCGGGGVVPAGTGGVSSGGTTAGNPGTVGLEFYSPSTSGLTMMSMAGPTVNGGVLVTMYGGEDIQVNLGPGHPSLTGAGGFITLQLVAN